MECITPGAIRDEELLAYLAGEQVLPFVIQHLAMCQRCAEQLATFKRLDAALTLKLYRWDCPTSLVLGEYELGLLNQEVAAAVKYHLSTCTLCTAEVAALDGFLANDPLLQNRSMMPVQTVESDNHHTLAGTKHAIERLREQSKKSVSRVVAALIPPQPRVAFQRDGSSATALWPRRYKAEDVSISIAVEQDTSKRDRLQIIGFVTRSGQAIETLQGTQVSLLLETGETALAKTSSIQQIDELGNFVFSSIAPAEYMLELQFPEHVVAIDHLPVTLQNS
jgi:anti-sigma factor RsiW